MKKPLFSAAAIAAALSLAGFLSNEAAPEKSGRSSKGVVVKPAVLEEARLEAEIDIQPQELAPDSSIEVRFPTSMVAKERVGTVEPVSPLAVQPELAGEFKWTSTRSGLYKLTQPPKFNATYSFKLKPGLKDVEGKSLSTEQLDEVNSAPFRIIDQYPKWFDKSDAARSPKFLFEFNDNVNPAEAAKAVFFNCAENKTRIPAKARHATGKDFEHHGAEAQATWAEVVSGAKPSISPDGARLSALVIEPESPLPVGKGWTLDLSATLKNMPGHDALAAGDSIALGDVLPFEVRDIGAHTPFDRDYFVRIIFNKSIASSRWDEDPKELAALAKRIAAVVEIEPAVELTGADADWRSVAIHGKFALNQPYSITVSQEVVSADGLPLQAVATAQKSFVPNPPYVAVPSFSNAQLATGKGEFECSVANVKQARVRAKRLTGPELLEAIEKYQPYETAFNSSQEKKAL